MAPLFPVAMFFPRGFLAILAGERPRELLSVWFSVNSSSPSLLKEVHQFFEIGTVRDALFDDQQAAGGFVNLPLEDSFGPSCRPNKLSFLQSSDTAAAETHVCRADISKNRVVQVYGMEAVPPPPPSHSLQIVMHDSLGPPSRPSSLSSFFDSFCRGPAPDEIPCFAPGPT